MLIYYDFELDDNLPQPENPKHGIVFDTLKAFVKSRYKILEWQVDASQEGEKVPFVVLRPSIEGIGISYFNIPNELITKLNGCISEEDFNYITNIIYTQIFLETGKN